MFDIKVFGGKAVTRRVRPIGEELEPRCLRFYPKFPGNWSVTVERKRTKHIGVCFFHEDGGHASKDSKLHFSIKE